MINSRKRILLTVILVVFVSIVCTSGIGFAFADNLSDVSIQSVSFTTQSETISYSYKVEERNSLGSFPDYYDCSSAYGYEVEAASTAANLIAYYGKRYTGVIDFTPGSTNGSSYIYSGMAVNTSQKQALIDSLYTYMNLSSDIRTVNTLRRGMLNYVADKGYYLGSYSIFSNGEVSYDELKDAVDDGYPTLVSVNGSNYVTTYTNGNTQTLTVNSFTGYHMCMVYGYHKIDYYNDDDELISSKLILDVSYGLDGTTFRSNRRLLADNITFCSAAVYLMWE